MFFGYQVVVVVIISIVGIVGIIDVDWDERQATSANETCYCKRVYLIREAHAMTTRNRNIEREVMSVFMIAGAVWLMAL